MKLEHMVMAGTVSLLAAAAALAAYGAWSDQWGWVRAGAWVGVAAFALACLPLVGLGALTAWERLRGLLQRRS